MTNESFAAQRADLPWRRQLDDDASAALVVQPIAKELAHGMGKWLG